MQPTTSKIKELEAQRKQLWVQLQAFSGRSRAAGGVIYDPNAEWMRTSLKLGTVGFDLMILHAEKYGNSEAVTRLKIQQAQHTAFVAKFEAAVAAGKAKRAAAAGNTTSP